MKIKIKKSLIFLWIMGICIFGGLLYNAIADDFNINKTYEIDVTAGDSGVTTAEHNRTIKDFLIYRTGTTEQATFVFKNTSSGVSTHYMIGSAIDLTSYPNIKLKFHNGARLFLSANFTIYNWGNIEAGCNQILVASGSTGTLSSANGGFKCDSWDAGTTTFTATSANITTFTATSANITTLTNTTLSSISITGTTIALRSGATNITQFSTSGATPFDSIQKVPTEIAVNLFDSRRPMKNFVINGGMDVWQRGTSFSGMTNTQFGADRWSYWRGGTTVTHTVSRSSDVPTYAQSGVNFQYSTLIHPTKADDTIGAGDFLNVLTCIEGYLANRLRSREITLSFWVKAYKPGIYCVQFANGATDRSYVHEYTISGVSTWQKRTVTLTMDSGTTGTWDWTTDVGLIVNFTLAAGSSFNGTNDTWQAGNKMRTTNQVNGIDSTNDDFQFTGVQLELGDHPTEFEQEDFITTLYRCYRYYQKSFNYTSGVTWNGGSSLGAFTYVPDNDGVRVKSHMLIFPVKMRGNPAIRTFNPGAANAKWRNTTDNADSGSVSTSFGESGGYIFNTQIVTDGTSDVISIHWAAFAEIGASEVIGW